MGPESKRHRLSEARFRKRKQEEPIKARSKVFSHVSASALAVLFVASLSQFDLDGLKGALVDALFRTQWRHRPHPAIALVAYDEEAAARYDGDSRLPPEELAQVLEALGEESPRAVAILGPINDRRYTPTELALIGKHLSRVPNPYIGYTDDESLGKNPPGELSGARFLPGFISRDTFSYGADSVSRRVMITIQSVPSVYGELANLARQPPPRGLRNVDKLGETGDSTQTYINWQGGPGTYPLVSTRLVAERRAPPGAFRDKIVLLGRALKSRSTEDFILTPLSRGPLATPMLEGAAHGLATLIDDNGIEKSSAALNWLVALVIGVLTVNLALFLPPWRGILFVLLEVVGLFVVAWVCLLFFDYWLNLAHPMVMACIGYYLVIPYRLVDEYRKRWHYQEKSELMSQLEQLKSNFLSLVTHDLKTPIARIQGNAELMLNESEMPDRQRSSVQAILRTTDELSKYVETILDLTRIESAEIPIEKSTKDINAAILEVIDTKMPLAEERNIRLATDLDPIFSFRFDGKLMRRVIANLVENAIKYSPEGSTITVSSREEGNWVHVSVADQGVGIPQEEQEKVFAKFYRGQNPLTSAVKGTGLGLYLARYFVELHEGIIRLRSEVGKGSTFTVSLPV